MHSHDPAPFPLVAGRLSLDFLNTLYGVGEEHRDVISDDASVVAWLNTVGVPVAVEKPPRGLAKQALALRTEIKQLLEAAKAGGAGDASLLNVTLREGQPFQTLAWHESAGHFAWEATPRDTSSASLLYPVALDMANLLAGDELAAVRECEAHDCTLLFVDTTKSRRRRWCSMAMCGNRMKVAAFRARKEAER